MDAGTLQDVLGTLSRSLHMTSVSIGVAGLLDACSDWRIWRETLGSRKERL